MSKSGFLWNDKKSRFSLIIKQTFKKTSSKPIRKRGPMRQRPDFCEAKQTYRQLYKEHVESTGEGNSPIHRVDQTRQSHRQRFKVSSTTTRFTLELDGNIYFNKFVFIRALAARRLEVESKLGLLAIFNLDSLFSCSGSFFSLARKFQFPGYRREV